MRVMSPTIGGHSDRTGHGGSGSGRPNFDPIFPNLKKQ